MKKILLFSVLIVLVAASCKKYQNPSITVTASFPTITFVNGNTPFFSVPLNGTLPTGAMVATAYDSFYKVSLAVVVIDSTVNTFQTGLYTATATAQNKYGYLTSMTYYVAVTNLPNNNLNLSGNWRMGTTDSFDNYISPVPLVQDYYSMANSMGVNLYTDSAGVTADIFAVITDSTFEFIDLNGNGAIAGNTGTMSLLFADTTMSFNGVMYKKVN